ncbi:MAG TPA: lipase family protein [Rudaea sp.]|nr:lipase family protein [Rudaea sp.]
MIDYDASRDALYRPALRPTVFASGMQIADIGVDATCAELSRLAYVPFESDEGQRRRLIEILDSLGLSSWIGFNAPATGTEAFAAIDSERGDAFVVFRGTAPGDIKDLATDLNVRPVAWAGGGNVHAGFSTGFSSVIAQIETWLEKHAARSTLTLAGHSLGAALATLAMSRWQASRLVTFGCPRVGDKEFAATIVNDNAVRYVGCCDVVCNVPPAGAWYSDAGSMRYIDRSGLVRVTLDAAGIAADRAKARREYLAKHAARPGNVLVRELADHAPINYVRALVPGSD